jgi:hypothetical protein
MERLSTTLHVPSQPDYLPVTPPCLIDTFFSASSLECLRLLRAAAIPHAIYSGAHVACLTARPGRGDVDVLVSGDYYEPTLETLGISATSPNCYHISPLYGLHGQPATEVSIAWYHDVELKFNTDGLPGIFDYTPLVEKYSMQVPGTPLTFVAIGETVLFKLALWRPKDQQDVIDIIAAGHLDGAIPYIVERLPETYVNEKIIWRRLGRAAHLLQARRQTLPPSKQLPLWGDLPKIHLF